MLGHQYANTDKSQQLVNYVEDYLECVESLPLDIQRNVSLLREIDAKYQGNLFIYLFLCLLHLWKWIDVAWASTVFILQNVTRPYRLNR